MKIMPIIHQQIVQLRWHFLACFGLLMALPIEEAIMNLNEGDGFCVTELSLGIPIMAGALLAGLIACGNVQADLDDRRYIFWRSKPVRVITFIALKYFVGLLMAFVVIGSPIAFGLITSILVQDEKLDRSFIALIINFQLISLLTYSLCFFCNVLIRKTARAWLIGMAMTCLLLLVPFVLPFKFKDISGDFLLVASTVYISITIGVSLIAFILSLCAVSRDWHLQTNLKGLLWTAASVVFLLMLLFSRQVANIKVLDEIQVPQDYFFSGNLQRIYSEVEKWQLLDVEITDNKIALNDVYIEPSEEIQNKLESSRQLYSVGEKGLGLEVYPTFDRIYYNNGKDTFLFQLHTYDYREEIRKNAYTHKLKEVYLCGYKLLHEGLFPFPVSVLDLTDCVDKEGTPKAGLRQIEDKLVVLIQDSIVVIQIKEGGGLELIDKQINGLKGYSQNLRYRDKVFKIPLVPVQGINIKEQIKLTIDLNYRYYHIYNNWQNRENFSRYSLTDTSEDKISYCLLNETEISRFDVIKWDDQYIYCKFRDQRPFTFLEQMFGQVNEYDSYFVQDGKLYAYEDHKLMVFDIRSDRIRKLGHFERLSENYRILDIEVLDNGDMLLNSMNKIKYGEKKVEGGYLYDYLEKKNYLTLLKNPE